MQELCTCLLDVHANTDHERGAGTIRGLAPSELDCEEGAVHEPMMNRSAVTTEEHRIRCGTGAGGKTGLRGPPRWVFRCSGEGLGSHLTSRLAPVVADSDDFHFSCGQQRQLGASSCELDRHGQHTAAYTCTDMHLSKTWKLVAGQGLHLQG